MSHNRKMTPDEAETVREFALFIRLAAQANDLQASLYQRALLKAQMDLTAALIDAAKPNTEHKRKRTRKRRGQTLSSAYTALIDKPFRLRRRGGRSRQALPIPRTTRPQFSSILYSSFSSYRGRACR